MPRPPRTRTVRKDLYRNYLVKSREFLRAAQDSLRRGDHDACVSAAIHSGINLADALATFYLQVRSAGESHEDVVALVRRVPLPPAESEQIVRHLSALLDVKNAAEYEERLLRAKEADAAMKHLERLSSRVLATLPRA